MRSTSSHERRRATSGPRRRVDGVRCRRSWPAQSASSPTLRRKRRLSSGQWSSSWAVGVGSSWAVGVGSWPAGSCSAGSASGWSPEVRWSPKTQGASLKVRWSPEVRWSPKTQGASLKVRLAEGWQSWIAPRSQRRTTSPIDPSHFRLPVQPFGRRRTSREPCPSTSPVGRPQPASPCPASGRSPRPQPSRSSRPLATPPPARSSSTGRYRASCWLSAYRACCHSRGSFRARRSSPLR
jgi:hypothetical protein